MILTLMLIQKELSSMFPKHGDDFTEADIEDIDMEDKQRRKKTLRFYTSKINKAAAKKTNHILVI